MFSISLIPQHAEAFWPFSTNNADAQEISVIPSSSTAALVAPLNIDPGTEPDIPLATSGDEALVAYSGPAGTVSDVEDMPATDRISVYVVRPGDTLSDIAGMFNVSVNTIIWANNLKGTKDIHVGDTLAILPVSGVKRIVAKGDTLKSLAKAYGADSDEIAQFNGINPTEALSVGSTIIIPGADMQTVPSTQKPSGSRTQGGSTAPSYSGYYANPVPGARLTQRLHGHNGVDFGTPRGTPVHASANGTVIIVRNSGWNGGYGNYVVITHPNGTQTLYAHLTNAIVSSGQSVTQGQIIGYSGNTGKSTGAHLHFEVRGTKNPFGR